MADKESSLPEWGGSAKLVELRGSGGYSTFAQDTAVDTDDNAALSYVHGINEEYRTNSYFRTHSRMRFGTSGRDFTVFVSIIYTKT